jgi:hypothetical protein
MTRKTGGMQFPVTLYHKDNGTPEFAADARHSQYTTYPIVVQDQDAYDRLGPGWCEDPVAASAWVPDVDESEPEQTEDDERSEAAEEPKKRKLPTTRKK